MLINKIQDFLNQKTQQDTENKITKKGIFDVCLYFQHLSLQYYSFDELHTLEKIGKKIEVLKKIFTFYDAKTFIPLNKQLIPPSFVDIIFCHYCGAFLKTNDYKFLNTALKLSSGVLSVDWQISLHLKILFEEFLSNEF